MDRRTEMLLLQCSAMLAFAIVVGSYLFNAGSIEAYNKLATKCNEQAGLGNSYLIAYKQCQAELEQNISFMGCRMVCE